MLAAKPNDRARAVPAVAGRSAGSATTPPPKRRRASSSRRTAAARWATTRWRWRSRSGGSIRRSSTRSRRRSRTSSRAAATNQATDLGLLLPHLGFAYQELGDFDKAIAAFEEAHRLAPTDPSITAYLVQANLSAKKYAAALELARKARAQNPDDLRFARLEAQALRQTGKADEAVSLLQDFVRQQPDKPEAYVALAQIYLDTKRGARRGEDAAGRAAEVPGRHDDRLRARRRPRQAEEVRRRRAAFRQVLSKDPDNAPALNYLGYMLAERGERLDESVDLLKKALAIEPDNGSYLDSLGWAYYKADKLDLALDQPAARRRSAADQLGHPGSLRRRALQALALRRCDRRVDPGARRRRRLDRPRRHRQEDPIREAEARQEMTRRSAAPLLALSAGVRVVRRAADEAAVRARRARAGRGATPRAGDRRLPRRSARQRSKSPCADRSPAAASAGACSPGSRAPASARLEAAAPFGQPVFMLTVARPATRRDAAAAARSTACSSTARRRACSKRSPACRSTPPTCARR